MALRGFLGIIVCCGRHRLSRPLTLAYLDQDTSKPDVHLSDPLLFTLLVITILFLMSLKPILSDPHRLLSFLLIKHVML